MLKINCYCTSAAVVTYLPCGLCPKSYELSYLKSPKEVTMAAKAIKSMTTYLRFVETAAKKAEEALG